VADKYPQKSQARQKVLKQARAMARSGRHLDHKSIIAELEHLAGFEDVRAHLEASAMRGQLDGLCKLVQEPQPEHYRTTTFPQPRMTTRSNGQATAR
jgi:hypothetical protein